MTLGRSTAKNLVFRVNAKAARSISIFNLVFRRVLHGPWCTSANATTQQLTDQQLAGINMLNKQLLGNQQQLGNPLSPQFQNTANNPGLSPADKAAVTAQSQGALGSVSSAMKPFASPKEAASSAA